MELRETEVDGVPVVWSEVPGPLRAGLLFRVGEADERLVEHGVTHLVEHAAIRTAGREHSLGGSVGLLETHFQVWGGEDRVVAGLAALCAALCDLPRDGLDVERRVLAAEAAASGSALPHLLLHERCGARGLGVAVLDELGLRALDDDAVLRWATRWFVRGNAALWLSGSPPAGLALELFDGDRAAAPDARALPGLALPARVDGPAGAVAVGALATSGADDSLAGLVAAALERRAHDMLRTTLGVSYEVDGRAGRVSGGARHVVRSRTASTSMPPASARGCSRRGATWPAGSRSRTGASTCCALVAWRAMSPTASARRSSATRAVCSVGRRWSPRPRYSSA